MRIAIGSAGTRSDLAFLFSLGKRLQQRHHTVTMIAPEKYRSEIMKMELRMVTCGRSFDEYLEGNSVDRSGEFSKALASQVASQFVSLRDALREADVFVSDALLVPAPSMAEKVGVPYFQLIQSPLLLDPEAFPFHGIPYERVSGLLAGRRKQTLRKEWEEILGSALNREREFSHLKPVTGLHQHFMGTGHQLIAVDPEIAQVEEAPNRTVVGYSNFEPSGMLNENIDTIFSEKKLAIFVDTLPVGAPERETFLKLLCETLGDSGHRIVIRSDWYGSEEKKFPENCFAIDPAFEFDALVQCAAAVHPGSPGFFMTCVRAGVPQVIVPYLVENFYWAERVQSLGLGPEPQRRFDAKTVASALMDAMKMREPVAAFAEKLRNRDGVAAACEAIENI